MLFPSDLTIAKSHVGNFSQGQTGATYTITVTNGGSVATRSEERRVGKECSGWTPTAAAGKGWSCGGIDSQTVTCTRSDALTAGASYPPINLTVNVAATAADSLSNTAVVCFNQKTKYAMDG